MKRRDFFSRESWRTSTSFLLLLHRPPTPIVLPDLSSFAGGTFLQLAPAMLESVRFLPVCLVRAQHIDSFESSFPRRPSPSQWRIRVRGSSNLLDPEMLPRERKKKKKERDDVLKHVNFFWYSHTKQNCQRQAHYPKMALNISRRTNTLLWISRLFRIIFFDITYVPIPFPNRKER